MLRGRPELLHITEILGTGVWEHAISIGAYSGSDSLVFDPKKVFSDLDVALLVRHSTLHFKQICSYELDAQNRNISLRGECVLDGIDEGRHALKVRPDFTRRVRSFVTHGTD